MCAASDVRVCIAMYVAECVAVCMLVYCVISTLSHVHACAANDVHVCIVQYVAECVEVRIHLHVCAANDVHVCITLYVAECVAVCMPGYCVISMLSDNMHTATHSATGYRVISTLGYHSTMHS